ncbi:spore gernimation protein [Mesobacillus campisalis]|uniref:Spore gernimation protein n=1 Tax=Mesobacillus campisalis TaxID=1408103 RepID=A0A0M2SXA2_9BACI|nr:GerAB/ArcD/ProY family transporter [Mesobacillus campisalis]KKK37245.1 spore gernimation protein [Mesobacillus campisalis]
MGDYKLFDKTAEFGNGFIIAFVHQSQLLYFVLFLPKMLQQSYLLFGILAVGILSQINLFILSKSMSYMDSKQGYNGFAKLFGHRNLRIIAFAGIAVILIKLCFIVLGYAEIVHQFIFPSMQPSWLFLFIMLICTYIASQGMEKTLRFGIIAFFCTFWMILLYIPYFVPPGADVLDLYPLIPAGRDEHPWKGMLMIWSSLSGPEYIILALPWINPKQKALTYLSIANGISVFLYIVLFMACLFFFGTPYLGKISYPVLNMIRYLQTPVFERIEIVMISMQMFQYVFLASFLLLSLYGAIRISACSVHKETGRKGLYGVSFFVLVCLFLIDQFFGRQGKELNGWTNLQLWSGTLTYLLIPSLLLVANIRRRRRSSH